MHMQHSRCAAPLHTVIKAEQMYLTRTILQCPDLVTICTESVRSDKDLMNLFHKFLTGMNNS